MVTVQIKLWGVVQGVGFRPFISRLAAGYGLKGWVLNEGGNVRIEVSGAKETVESFINDITAKKPGPAEIVHMELERKEYIEYDSFRIIESSEGGDDIVFIPADLSICKSCTEELFDEADRRHLHPFISCMICGPRYSIFDRVPYDRHNTSMVDFPMCEFCNGQYTYIEDRRYHAQTISCHDCGPYLIYNSSSEPQEQVREAALERAVAELKDGKIVAVKGVGGYHLVCSPFRTEAVDRLRQLKGREEKPFAVMFYDAGQLSSYCYVSEQEKTVLESKERPIVLLRRREHELSQEQISQSVYRSSMYLGAFLPYTPLQYLILKETGPLIMTSANISDQPIIKDDCEILSLAGQSELLAGVLYNKRDIRISIDDSVVKCIDDSVQITRRSRGYAPLPVYIKGTEIDKSKQILACGGQLKNTFCLTKGNFAYPSQYIGDMENEQTLELYRENLERMKSLLRIEPKLVCCDLHPDYPTTRLAESLGMEVIKVQHHYAHIASVMAEKGLYEDVIGISFDGTGYGEDGRIWGGEFLICSPKGYRRAGHLRYIPMLGGDTSIKEAWKSAMAYMYSAGAESEIKDGRWHLIKSALANKINTIDSSSMGRHFDAVSSILDIGHFANYEGECAIKLENEALLHALANKAADTKPYRYETVKVNGCYEIDTSAMIRQILSDKLSGADIGYVSYRFHLTVAEFTAGLCRILREENRINKVALSGGVFQNSILFEMLLKMLREAGFEVHYNTMVPANDGGISLGQAFVGMNV